MFFTSQQENKGKTRKQGPNTERESPRLDEMKNFLNVREL